MKVQDKIKLLRKQKNLTQTELGEILGVKKNAVSKWETGRVEDIPTSKIKAMADLFGVAPSYFIDDGDPVGSSAKAKIAELTKDMTDSQIEEIIRYAEFLKQRG